MKQNSINRSAKLKRSTNETVINCKVNLTAGSIKLDTGIAFFNHMLDQVARHGGLSLQLTCKGDLAVDQHHTVEDCGIVLGQAIGKALGDKSGIVRFATQFAPLDEALARSVIDISGRPGLFFRATFSRSKVGEFESQLVREFFQGFANAIQATIHIDLLEGSNAHHQIESIFKSFGLALRQAISVREVAAGVPSTKGIL